MSGVLVGHIVRMGVLRRASAVARHLPECAWGALRATTALGFIGHNGRWVMQGSRLAGLSLAVALLSACASVPPPAAPPEPSARVSGEVLLDPATPVAEAPEREVFETPQQLAGNPLPEYPAALLGAGLPPQSVSARIVVDGSGRVARVEALPLSTGDTQADPAFFDAVHSALLRWRFEPFRVIRWAQGPDLDGDGESDSETMAGEETRPFRFDMRFHFEVIDGVARVSS
jgi:hypothetical protein